MNRYCLININGLKSKPLCKKYLFLTKSEHDKGFRITKSTLGLNTSVTKSNIRGRLVNNYTFDRYMISLVWLTSITNDDRTVDNSFGGKMNVEIMLEGIHLLDNGKLINEQLPCNTLQDLIIQINQKIPSVLTGVSYIELDIVKMLFYRKYYKLFEYLIGLIENKSNKFVVTEKKIIHPTNIDLKMEIS